jgi:hypothetical protein
VSTELRERLREDPLPGEAEAAARSWPVVEAALAERTPAPARRRLVLRLALVAGLVAVGLAAALSPAGAWIEDRFDDGGGERTAPAFRGLPPGDPALAISRSGAYAIHPDGSTQHLGGFTEAGWSPRGLHVVGVAGRRLTAVDPLGTPKWTLARPGRVQNPAWSTGLGYEVAYLEDGTLRSVDGRGDPGTDRLVRRRAAAVTPAWRPRSDRVLVYARSGEGIEAVDVVTRRTLWRAPVTAHSLAWSRGGGRLVALSSSSVAVLDARGRVLRTLPLPGARELALHPSGRHAAVTVEGAGGMRVLDVPLAGGKPRQLFQGDVDGLAWSADGRRLLLAWRDADQWLLLGPRGRVRVLNGVSRELGAAGGFPRLAGWCCPR